jgi:PKD repeat protein
MRLRYNLLFLAFLAGSFVSLNAQVDHFTCGHAQRTQELWEKDPQLREDYRKLMESSRQTAKSGEKVAPYIIPVVFHIVHQYGEENITDEQVYNQVAILNRDYRKLNADTIEAVAGFDTLIADCNIQFRLASLDPSGRPTNGIEHIYSHETANGDDYSKLNQWHRSKYLNVWVVKSMRDGVAGYAFYPSDVDGSSFFRDGIIILNQYIGNQGTSNETNSRALTHEIGHYLGLAHPWGSTNDPGESCEGNDFIDDTPTTKGYDFCPQTLAAATICTPGVVENYQNYMDYSYCSIMFTKDQATAMQNSLENEAGNRNKLWLDTNLVMTGINVQPAPLAAPKADFDPTTRMVCEGDVVNFEDVSWRGVVANRTWYFEGGTPATSTSATPSVTFTGGGYRKVTLAVHNAAGSDSIIVNQAVYLSEPWSIITGPHQENFEGGQSGFWLVENPEENYAKFGFSNTNGYSNSKCWKLGNYKDITAAQEFTDEYYYNFRKGGNRDALVTPSYNLSNTSGVSMTFDYAYATDAPTLDLITEKLYVYYSKNCGKTWALRKTIAAGELLTAGNAGNQNFAPTNNTLWKTVTVNLPGLNATDTRSRFKFEFIASDVSNNLYIDNVNISGVLSVDENPLNEMEMSVYPNPTSAQQGISINYTANENAVEFVLMDVQGKILTTETNNTVNAAVTHELQLAAPLAAGCYYLKISQGQFQLTQKVVVM